MRHAREEYLFQYAYMTPVSSIFWHCPTEVFFLFTYPIRLAIYVLESSNSRRLTYFMPPLVSPASHHGLLRTMFLCVFWKMF